LRRHAALLIAALAGKRHPQLAEYTGSGSTNAAANVVCRNPQ
jgi:hypothetical protein